MVHRRQWYFGGDALALLALALIGWSCSQSGGRVVGRTVDRNLPKPSRVLFYDVGTADKQIVIARGPTRQPPVPTDPASRRRQLAEDVAFQFMAELTRQLEGSGFKVERVPRSAPVDDHDIVLDGRITSIDEGNAFTRVAIGFGSGKSSVSSRLRLYQGSELRKLLEVATHADSGSLPGAAATLPAGAAIQGGLTAATLAGSAMTTGIDLVRTDVGQLAIANARQGAQHLMRFFAHQGWLQSEQPRPGKVAAAKN